MGAGLGFRLRLEGSGFRVWGLGFRVQDLGSFFFGLSTLITVISVS